jgi:hypothetical protein
VEVVHNLLEIQIEGQQWEHLSLEDSGTQIMNGIMKSGQMDNKLKYQGINIFKNMAVILKWCNPFKIISEGETQAVKLKKWAL